jgi:biotin carboxylase
MRRAFQQAGLEQMRYKAVSYPGVAAYEFAQQTGYPLMVKATDNCGSRGTSRVDMPNELDHAVADAIANSTSHTALLEEYLTGEQQSVEVLFNEKGECRYLNIVDRPFDGVMELGHVNPTRLSASRCRALFELTERAAAAVGVRYGAFKCDTIWTADGPRVLECTARLSGGWDCQLSTPRATGRDFITAAMRAAVWLPPEPVDLRPKWRKYCAVWAAFPKPGTVVSINDSFSVMPHGVTDIRLRVAVGDVIAPYSHCATRPGFVAAVADTYGEAVERAQSGAALLAERIVTE